MQTFGTDFPVCLQFQFVYRLLVQTFQFVYRLCCFHIDIWYRLSSLDVVLVCIQAFGIDFPVWLQVMLVLYRHLVLTFQFGYSSSLYTGFCHRLSFQFGYRLCCFYIDIWQRLPNSAIVLVCILPFGIDFRSSFAIGNVVFIQTFGTDFPVCLQFQFVYKLLVQTFQFGNRPCFYYIEIWYRLSISAIVLICILAFGIDFPVCLLAMMFLYRHLVQTFQFGYSSSLYTGFWYRLSSQFGYWLCCFYIDISYRLSSSSIVLVCILAFDIDFPAWLQVMLVLYRHLVLTFQFGYSSSLYTGFWNRLSSLSIGYVRHLVQTFQFGCSSSLYTGVWYRLSSLVIGNVAFISTFGADFPVCLQFQFVYRLLVQTFQFGYRQCCFYIEILYRLSSLAVVLACILDFGTDFLSSLARQCCFYIDIQYRLSSLDVVLVCIQAFGIEFPVWLQANF